MTLQKTAIYYVIIYFKMFNVLLIFNCIFAFPVVNKDNNLYFPKFTITVKYLPQLEFELKTFGLPFG